jgi:aspartate aminotransferase
MYNEKMYSLGSKRSIIREIFEYCKVRSQEIGKDKVFDFSIGNPSVEPPKEIGEAILDLAKNADSVLLHGYTSAQGDLGVRQAIAKSINDRFSAGVSENNIYMTCGAAASLTISLKALFNPGDECVLFAPFFTEYRVFVENAGGVVVISKPMEKTFQIDLADFESKITEKTKAVIANSPNNPSGAVLSRETIEALSKLLNEKQKEFGTDIYIIADEPYRELAYAGIEVPYIPNFYDNTVVCYSFSKSLSLPGERIGYIFVSPKAKDAADLYAAVCGAGRALGFVCAPSLLQYTVKECLGQTADLSVYEENRNLFYNALTEYGYSVVRPDGAFYLFLKSPEPDANAFCEKAKKYELLIVPGDSFGCEGYVRISYCVKTETIKKALPAFKKLMEEYR